MAGTKDQVLPAGHLLEITQGFLAWGVLPETHQGIATHFNVFPLGKEQHVQGKALNRVGDGTLVKNHMGKSSLFRLDGRRQTRRAGPYDRHIHHSEDQTFGGWKGGNGVRVQPATPLHQNVVFFAGC